MQGTPWFAHVDLHPGWVFLGAKANSSRALAWLFQFFERPFRG